MVVPETIDTWVELAPDTSTAPIRIEVDLRYYDAVDATEPIHTDTLVYSLEDLIGTTPRTSLRDPTKLREQLADRSQQIAEESARILRLKYLLDQIPAGHRFTRAEARVMLEGALDGG